MYVKSYELDAFQGADITRRDLLLRKRLKFSKKFFIVKEYVFGYFCHIVCNLRIKWAVLFFLEEEMFP